MTAPPVARTAPQPRARRCIGRSLRPAAAALLACLAVAAAHAQNRPDPAEDAGITPDGGVTPGRIYCGVGRAVPITVITDRVGDGAELIVLNARGEPLIEPVPVHRGPHDLAEHMPDIWRLRTTAYLQLLENDRPVGPAIVLQPMLSRMVPVTETAERSGADGAAYTRITGYRSETTADEPDATTDLQPDEADAAPDDRAADGADAQPAADGDENNTPEAPATPETPTSRLARQFADAEAHGRIFSGLRMYVDRDVVLDTTHGEIRLSMRPDAAPNTAWNFLQLAEGGYYDGVTFHRIVPADRAGNPFVIQAGDPSGTGEGGPGYWLPIEPSNLPHDLGVISMARADDPDSAGGQFFIGLSREGTARLDGQYCAFGQTQAGEETIRAIADVQLADVATGRPADPPTIRSARLVDALPRAIGDDRTAAFALEADESEAESPPPPPGRVPR